MEFDSRKLTAQEERGKEREREREREKLKREKMKIDHSLPLNGAAYKLYAIERENKNNCLCQVTTSGRL